MTVNLEIFFYEDAERQINKKELLEMKDNKTIKEKLRERAIEAELLEELFDTMDQRETWYMDYRTDEDGSIIWEEPENEETKKKLAMWREIKRKVEKVFEL